VSARRRAKIVFFRAIISKRRLIRNNNKTVNLKIFALKFGDEHGVKATLIKTARNPTKAKRQTNLSLKTEVIYLFPKPSKSYIKILKG